jgi:capsid protein
LPFEFAADSSKIGGAGVRLVVAKADRRFSYRQLILIQRFLLPVWAYVIGDGVARGELPAQPGWHKVRWQRPKKVTVDAGREAQQNRADVETGLKTLSESYSELGLDFEEQAEVRAQDARLMIDLAAKYGVPLEMLYRPSTGAVVVGEQSDEVSPPQQPDRVGARVPLGRPAAPPSEPCWHLSVHTALHQNLSQVRLHP